MIFVNHYTHMKITMACLMDMLICPAIFTGIVACSDKKTSGQKVAALEMHQQNDL